MGFGDKSKKEKAAEKNALQEAKAKHAEEHASWAENDKSAKKKLDRAAAQAEKDAEALRKREEKKALEAADNEATGKIAESAAAKKGKAKAGAGKLTQAQIQANMALMAAAAASAKPKKAPKKTQTVDPEPIQENTNRNVDVVATSVEEALAQLEIDPKSNKKMTYKEFEQDMLDRVKADNPNLKQAQVKEKVWKLWERSPLNPKNVKPEA